MQVSGTAQAWTPNANVLFAELSAPFVVGPWNGNLHQHSKLTQACWAKIPTSVRGKLQHRGKEETPTNHVLHTLAIDAPCFSIVLLCSYQSGPPECPFGLCGAKELKQEIENMNKAYAHYPCIYLGESNG